VNLRLGTSLYNGDQASGVDHARLMLRIPSAQRAKRKINKKEKYQK
jgi:hypothetical protein